MSPPIRPPNWFDAFSGKEEPHDRIVGWLIEDVAQIPKHYPDWMLDNDVPVPVEISLLEHEAEKRAVLRWTAGNATGTLTATRDPSGWLLVVAEFNGMEVLRGYVERIYEEYEVWPAGSSAEPAVDSPGRIGKKQSWTSLQTSAWPKLAPIANENGWVNIRIDDDKLSAKLEREGR